MSLIDQFLIMAAIICSFSGCAAVSMDRAVEAETVSAVSGSDYSILIIQLKGSFILNTTNLI